MTTEVHESANGNLKKIEVEPLGEIKEDVKKPADLCNAGDANGKVDKSGCESLADKEEPEPLTKNGASKQKRVVNSGEDEDEEDEVNEPQDGNDYSSEEEEGEGEGDEVRGEVEPYEEEDEEYVDDGEEDEGDDDESEPPSKRRK